MNVDALSTIERRSTAERERRKGNEAYRAGELEESLVCYSRSLALDDRAAAVFGNRAAAALKLGRLELAEDDATRQVEVAGSETRREMSERENEALRYSVHGTCTSEVAAC
ncbi:unnamed protein product [Phaeothamnion confervicola]